MSISAYVGLTGHGKSYGAVENVIIPALKSKRTVFTNIPMKTQNCIDDFGHEVVPFNIDDVIKNPNWFKEVFIAGAILVIDELWRLWPAGMKTADINMAHKEFLAEHRHLVGDGGFSTEIIFVTQDLTQLATFSTLLIDTTFRTIKQSKMGADKSFRIDVFSGSVKGPNPPISKREREMYGNFKETKGNAGYYYISHTKSTEGKGNETRTDKRFKVLGGIKFKIMAIGFFALLFFVYLLGTSFYENSALIAKPESNELDNKSEVVKPTQSKLQPTVSAVPVVIASDSNDVVSRASEILSLGVMNKIYYYQLSSGNASSFVTSVELGSLGYTVTHVNNCLSKIEGFNKVHFSMCKDNRSKSDFVTNVMN